MLAEQHEISISGALDFCEKCEVSKTFLKWLYLYNHRCSDEMKTSLYLRNDGKLGFVLTKDFDTEKKPNFLCITPLSDNQTEFNFKFNSEDPIPFRRYSQQSTDPKNPNRWIFKNPGWIIDAAVNHIICYFIQAHNQKVMNLI